ncbi:hypothetical protein E1262_24380 [Jiangella aurantiaca]|uniref:Uncharacterized protein n=1 Tax=Jiangella aurantiaca TaxID=2530373 RepID=A0A4R5A1R0_9ACTN|nr:hypothetical protein [Jiangella aurantiaca]TDD65691.1 hypothetical protein E1262_24380 [Jiangella aurantiaca]
MNEDEQLRERFRGVGFAGEPPMASTAADDLARGRRHLRRRRAAALSGGVVGMVAVAAGVALALPGGGPAGDEDLPVAGGSAAETSAPPATTPTEPTATPSEMPGGFSLTRQLLRETAAEHFDPAGDHLNNDANSLHGGGFENAVNVGTKLGWTVPGEDGEGLVQVGVTAPGYVDAGEYAVENFIVDFGCDLPEHCTEQTVPGTGETVLVAPPNPDMHLQFAVSYERADGSMVGVAVYDLFGNNSLAPVSEVEITLEQAFAFVTDADLRVDPDEAAGGYDAFLGPEATAECAVSGETTATADADAKLREACEQAEDSTDDGASEEPSDKPTTGE